MGLLDDKVYNNLDYVSILIEPWNSTLITLVSSMPDTVEITGEFIKNHQRYDCQSLYTGDILSEELAEGMLPWQKYLLRNHLMIKCVIEPDTTYDYVTHTLNKNIIATIDKSFICEANIPKMMTELIRFFANEHERGRRMPCNKQLMDIVSTPEDDGNGNYKVLRRRLYRLVEENTWNIRSDELMVNIIEWFFLYNFKDNYAALINLLNVKCMTHNKKPIYSAEVENV